MTLSLKPTAFALAALGLAAAAPVAAQTTLPALGQDQVRSLAPGGAAATLPNTFDSPTATPTPAAPLPSTPRGQVTDSQMAEAALRAVIEQFRAADIDERLFTPSVAAQLNAQLAEYSRRIRSYGAVQSIETQSASDGVGQFVVIFENAATQWQVGLEDGGLVAALRFREAPPESSEPTAPDA